jgi:hypothetical protein
VIARTLQRFRETKGLVGFREFDPDPDVFADPVIGSGVLWVHKTTAAELPNTVMLILADPTELEQ